MLRQPRDPGQESDRRRHGHVRHDRMAAGERVESQRRVGMVGTSYGAWLSVMGMLDPHPALKAIVQQASPADMWLGDDFHHNGAFRLSYGLEYAYMMESSKEITDPTKIIDRSTLTSGTCSLDHYRMLAKYFKGGCRAGTTSSIIRITTRSGNDRALSRG